MPEDDRLFTFVPQLTDNPDKQLLREHSYSQVNNQQQSTFQSPSPLLTDVDLLAITNKKNSGKYSISINTSLSSTSK
jgi:hypothetical protein